jgi:hypothetical protein
VAVWLLDTHPYNAPLCYVKPTQVPCLMFYRYVAGTSVVDVDPKLFFSDPDPIFVPVLDPDSDPDHL